jgi:hypothetical protein
MTHGLKQKHVVSLCIGLLVVIWIVSRCWPLLAVRYGGPVTRQVVISEWSNQRSKLSLLQKKVLFALLYKDVGDPEAKGQALAALNSHLKEDEPEIVRHLSYVALTAKSPSDCTVALAGLMHVSPNHQEIAKAVFLYQLKHADPNKTENALKLSTSMAGLAGQSYLEARPLIKNFTNSPNQYLAESARRALAKLDDSEKIKIRNP